MKINFNYAAFKTWMIGGQIDSSGNTCEGWNTFNEHIHTLKNKNDVREAIDVITSECAEDFQYYGEVFNFHYTHIGVPKWAEEKLTSEILNIRGFDRINGGGLGGEDK